MSILERYTDFYRFIIHSKNFFDMENLKQQLKNADDAMRVQIVTELVGKLTIHTYEKYKHDVVAILVQKKPGVNKETKDSYKVFLVKIVGIARSVNNSELLKKAKNFAQENQIITEL